MNDEELEEFVDQVLEGLASTIPDQTRDIIQNKMELGIDDPLPFVYGVIMGMAVATIGGVLSQEGQPDDKSLEKVRALIYAKLPAIKDRIFGQ